MDFEYSALKKFLAHLRGISKYSDLRSLPEFEIPTHETLYLYANESSVIFEEVRAEFEKNKLCCTTPLQLENLKNYYTGQLKNEFSDFIEQVSLASSYGDKKNKDFITGKSQLNKNYKEGNNLSLPQMNDLSLSYSIIRKGIEEITALHPNEELQKEEVKNVSKDKLTHKQQILLLKQIGFFELPFCDKLTTANKGKLVSNLLNRTEKDSVEIVRGLQGKPDEKYNTNTNRNKETVNKLLTELGLTECLVK
jgi:hypothetical protein